MGNIFSTPKTPSSPPPALMPDPEDELRRQRARQQLALRSSQGGRASTINTTQQNVVTGTEKLGVK